MKKIFSTTGILVVILGVALAIRVPFFNVPLDGDSGVFAAIGRLMSHGYVLYRDVFEIKPPGIYAMFSFLFRLGSLDVLHVHVFTAGWALLNTLLVWMLARMFFDRRTGLLAALLYGIFSASPYIYGTMPVTENFMMTFVLSGMAVLSKALRSHKRRYFFITGFLFGIGFLFKQIIVMELLAACLAVGIFARAQAAAAPRKFFITGIGYGIAGFISVMGVCAGYFAAMGAWRDFVFCVFTFNARYIHAGHLNMQAYWRNLYEQTMTIFCAMPLLFLVPAIVAVSYAMRCRARACGQSLSAVPGSFLIVCVWAACAACGVALSGFFIPHYYIVLIAPLAIIAAYWIQGAYKLVVSKTGMICIVLFCMAQTVFAHAVYYSGISGDRIAVAMFGEAPFPEMRHVGQYIQRVSLPQDYIFNWSKEPELFFYTDRLPVSRYLWISPYTVYSHVIPQGVQEVARALKKNPPQWIVLDSRWAPYRFAPEYINIRQALAGYRYVIDKMFPVVRYGRLVSVITVLRRQSFTPGMDTSTGF